MDTYSDWQWNSSLIGHWLTEILDMLEIKPPAGVSWSGHSLRSGGATAAYSIGVYTLIVMRFGLWKCLASAQIYIDVLALPDAAARLFFGHLLRGRSKLGQDLVTSGLWRVPALPAVGRACTWRSAVTTSVVEITLLRCLSTVTVSRDQLVAHMLELANHDLDVDDGEPCPSLLCN